ncbi:MAG: tRNA 2-thiouridine(34) synthase MnmA [Thermodesulfobacteriota bacterium]
MVTAIALSGGLDSLVAAFLLKQQQQAIIGIHFITGYETVNHDGAVADGKDTDCRKMAPIADQLDIPVHIIDCRNTFESAVVDYFIQTYGRGRTPNPCVVCNKRIKFGWLAEAAQKLGALRVATGHYARRSLSKSRYRLRKGMDPDKDQSYFLGMLSQQQLARACFPLGENTKAEVRQIASDHELIPVSGGESQDICFIRNQSYRSFVEARFQKTPHPGPIVDSSGNVLGRHDGLHRFTIGQRRGINCPASAPYYVLRLDVENNCLVVGFEDELSCRHCEIGDVNWIAPMPDAPMRVQIQIRYRHRPVNGTIEPITATRAALRFDRPESAVTPGQAAVCYIGDEIVAAGWIENHFMDNLHDDPS